MLTLLLIVVGTALVLAGFFVASTLFLQGYLYSEPTEGIAWRGPAAGAAVALFIGLWLLLARSAPDGRYRTLIEFSPRDSTQFQDLWVPGPDGSKVHYQAVESGARLEYRRNGRPGTENRWRSRPATIFVKEGGEFIEFKPDRDEKGNFKTAENQPLAYRDASGRVMTENFPGRLEPVRWGQFFVNVLLNLAFLGVLLVVIWLLLGYQFWHAFGMTWILWGVLILFVLPPLITYAESLGR